MEDPRRLLQKVQYQVGPRRYDYISNGFAQLDVHFPRVAFGDKFGCKQPTRFTQEEVVDKINGIIKELNASSGDAQTDLAAHLQVWAGLLRAVGCANNIHDEVYDVFVWF